MQDTVGEQKNKYNKYLMLYTYIIGLYLVARGGIEPPTHGFSVRCSTN